MQDDPLQPGQEQIEESLLSARVQLFRGRYREALDLVNDTVLLAPNDPRAFLIRAAAFEGMELIPQADADIAHAQALCAGQNVDFDALVDELNQPPPKREKRHRPPPPPRHRSRGAGIGEMAIIVGFIIFLAVAVGAGTYIVIGSLNLNNGDNTGSAANPTSRAPDSTVVATDTPAPSTPALSTRTPTSAASLPAGVNGEPYSLSSVETAWEAEGLTVTAGSQVSGFSGFSIAPTAVNVSASGESSRTAVFVYDDAAATSEDWTLVLGERPQPNTGNTVPSHFTIYWNTNVVIVVLDDPGVIGEDLLNGIINMTP